MKTIKKFDCIAMKRRIQEHIYKETARMNHEEFRTYVRERIEKSRFGDFLRKPGSNTR
jgi:hypothetical protein